MHEELETNGKNRDREGKVPTRYAAGEQENQRGISLMISTEGGWKKERKVSKTLADGDGDITNGEY